MLLHLQSSSLLIIPLIFVFSPLINTQPSLCKADYRFHNCSQQLDCGGVNGINYPFWGVNRANYCGEPSYHVDCKNNVPKIRMMSNTLRILQINNEEKILKVARDDLWDNICPTHFSNTSVDFKRFSYAPGQKNLTIYYDCISPSDPDESYPYFPQPECVINETRINVFYMPWYVRDDPPGISCNSSVIVPFIETNTQGIQGNNLRKTLDKGFNLEWNLSDDQCETCVESGGFCGYNSSMENRFVCFCRDQPYRTSCPFRPGKRRLPPAKVAGIAVGAAGALVILGVLVFLIIRRRTRKMAAKPVSKDLETPHSSKNTSITGTTTTTSNSTSANFSSVPSSYRSSRSDVGKASTYFGAQVFNYLELEEATNNFDSSKELGDGGFGTVYHGVLKDGREVAVKRLYEHNFKRMEQFMTEVEILTRLRHPNLVMLYGCTSRRSRELLLVYEYVRNGTLADHLTGRQSTTNMVAWSTRLSIAIETANALAYLHASDVIHRDVKSNNILLDQMFHVKVADFGLSRLFPNDVTHVSTAPQGTPGYVDPEYYQCYQLTDKSDVYSFGVVLIELLSSLPAVDTERIRHDINLSNMAINRIQNHKLHELVDQNLGFETDYKVRTMITSVAELAFRCLQQDRDMRPSMQEVLEVLRGIRNNGKDKAEEVDICNTNDEVVLLKNIPPPVSPDSSSF